MKPTHVLFARIGWMNYYRGIMPGDETLIGGGRYNEKNIGSEVVNFKPVKGRVYGYVQPASNADNRLALDKIDPDAAVDSEQLKDVLVVFVAKKPSVSQVIVDRAPSASCPLRAPGCSPVAPRAAANAAVV